MTDTTNQQTIKKGDTMLTTREIVELQRENDRMKETIERLTTKTTTKRNQTSRKDQVIELLKSSPMTIKALATELNITAKNISSQLTYIRKDGEYDILTDKGGMKKLVERITEPIVETEPETKPETLLDINELPVDYSDEDEIDGEIDDIVAQFEAELSEIN